MANAKDVMNTIWAENLSVAAGLRLELDRNALYCLTSEDAPEGLLAFSEKRAAEVHRPMSSATTRTDADEDSAPFWAGLRGTSRAAAEVR